MADERRLADELAAAQETIRLLETEIAAARVAATDAERQIETARVAATDAERQIEDARIAATDSERQLETARSRLGELEAELQAARVAIAKLEALQSEATGNARDAESQLDAARARFAEMAAELAAARAASDDLEAQLVGARRERERLLGVVDHWRERARRGRPVWRSLLPRSRRSPLPARVRRARDRISRRHLRGDGIEIGALHSPVALSGSARARYVDRLPTEALRREYPELADFDLVEVDIVDDGERLDAFPPESLDFVVANHMLEHCENPLGTLRSHLARLRRGGLLYYAVPDRRGSFDADRPLTTFEHLVQDDQRGPEQSRFDHYLEYAERVEKVAAAEVNSVARNMLSARSNIHFHVWEDTSFRDLVERAPSHLGVPLELLHLELSDTEIVAVVRKG